MTLAQEILEATKKGWLITFSISENQLFVSARTTGMHPDDTRRYCLDYTSLQAVKYDLTLDDMLSAAIWQLCQAES